MLEDEARKRFERMKELYRAEMGAFGSVQWLQQHFGPLHAQYDFNDYKVLHYLPDVQFEADDGKRYTAACYETNPLLAANVIWNTLHKPGIKIYHKGEQVELYQTTEGPIRDGVTLVRKVVATVNSAPALGVH